ncbi:MAG TPA: hypothetical protein VL326_06905 [Kofleriaceae bacterium]|jgi:hypothetical protein|nr:hypothetical protein [Kofleriaceae bacterium]
MKWQVLRQAAGKAPYVEANGKGEVEGYKALWYYAIEDVKIGSENDGRGNMWPVGMPGEWQYALAFDGRADRIEIGPVNPTDLLVLKWWTAGKGRGKATSRGVNIPVGERLEHVARTHMELGDGVAAIKAIAPNYMAVMQNWPD